MSATAVPVAVRPADQTRRLVRLGLLGALVFALSVGVMQFEVNRECRVGLFSAGFSAGFNGRVCKVVLKRLGRDLIEIPLPRDW